MKFYKNEKSKDKKATRIYLLTNKFNLSDKVGEIMLDYDSSINFQDLQSKLRTLRDYDIYTSNIEENWKKNIIFFQTCRHIFTHQSGMPTQKYIDRLEKAHANLKNLSIDSKVILDASDWQLIKDNFSKFIGKITSMFDDSKT